MRCSIDCYFESFDQLLLLLRFLTDCCCYCCFSDGWRWSTVPHRVPGEPASSAEWRAWTPSLMAISATRGPQPRLVAMATLLLIINQAPLFPDESRGLEEMCDPVDCDCDKFDILPLLPWKPIAMVIEWFVTVLYKPTCFTHKKQRVSWRRIHSKRTVHQWENKSSLQSRCHGNNAARINHQIHKRWIVSMDTKPADDVGWLFLTGGSTTPGDIIRISQLCGFYMCNTGVFWRALFTLLPSNANQRWWQCYRTCLLIYYIIALLLFGCS